MGKRWTKSEDELLKLNWPKENKKTILKYFPNTKWRRLKSRAIKLKIRRKITENTLYNLLKEEPEIYYWIGFLMADGYYGFNKNIISFQLAPKDKKQVYLFSRIIGGKVEHYVSKELILQFGKYVYRDSYCVRKSDKIIFREIVNKFDIKPNKTYHPPNNLKIKNDDLFIAFMIGYIDGDGSISKVGGIKIKCHYSWSKVLDKWFDRIWKLSKSELFGNNGNFVFPKSKIFLEKDNKNVVVNRDKVARIMCQNKKFTMFLKEKSKELKLPILERKWNRIK